MSNAGFPELATTLSATTCPVVLILSFRRTRADCAVFTRRNCLSIRETIAAPQRFFNVVIRAAFPVVASELPAAPFVETCPCPDATSFATAVAACAGFVTDLGFGSGVGFSSGAFGRVSVLGSLCGLGGCGGCTGAGSCCTLDGGTGIAGAIDLWVGMSRCAGNNGCCNTDGATGFGTCSMSV